MIAVNQIWYIYFLWYLSEDECQDLDLSSMNVKYISQLTAWHKKAWHICKKVEAPFYFRSFYLLTRLINTADLSM